MKITENIKSLFKKTITEVITKSYEIAKVAERFKTTFRECAKLKDKDVFLLLTKRVLGKHESGRAFLEELKMADEMECSRSGYFQLLNSERRSAAIKAISTASFKQFEQLSFDFNIDYLEDYPELQEYSVINGDGHFISHGSHTKGKRNKTFAAGSIYIQSARTGNMFPLAVVSDGSSKAHEMPVFKEYVETMPSDYFGRPKTLWVVDRGFINNYWWGFQKKKGHYFITRTKDNFSPDVCGILSYDKNNPINKGVENYYLAGFSSGFMFTVVDYRDPETDEKFSFITSLDGFGINPGLIAWLYFKRWNIEKSFDNSKNTLHETKAWGTGKNTINIQSHIIAFVYNMMRLIHELIIKQENKETISKIKYDKWLEERKKTAKKKGFQLHPLLFKARMSRIPSSFVRCFRKCFFDNVPWELAMTMLKQSLFTRL